MITFPLKSPQLGDEVSDIVAWGDYASRSVHCVRTEHAHQMSQPAASPTQRFFVSEMEK